jgi:hypothetical protein
MQEFSALTYIQRNIEVCTVLLWAIGVQTDSQGEEERQDYWYVRNLAARIGVCGLWWGWGGGCDFGTFAWWENEAEGLVRRKNGMG